MRRSLDKTEKKEGECYSKSSQEVSGTIREGFAFLGDCDYFFHPFIHEKAGSVTHGDSKISSFSWEKSSGLIK